MQHKASRSDHLKLSSLSSSSGTIRLSTAAWPSSPMPCRKYSSLSQLAVPFTQSGARIWLDSALSLASLVSVLSLLALSLLAAVTSLVLLGPPSSSELDSVLFSSELIEPRLSDSSRIKFWRTQRRGWGHFKVTEAGSCLFGTISSNSPFECSPHWPCCYHWSRPWSWTVKTEWIMWACHHGSFIEHSLSSIRSESGAFKLLCGLTSLLSSDSLVLSSELWKKVSPSTFNAEFAILQPSPLLNMMRGGKNRAIAQLTSSDTDSDDSDSEGWLCEDLHLNLNSPCTQTLLTDWLSWPTFFFFFFTTMKPQNKYNLLLGMCFLQSSAKDEGTLV